MKPLLLILCVAACTIGCQTRSISNSDYHGSWMYRGELSELEVLGVAADEQITEADIAAALEAEAKVTLRRGDRVVVVQSGAQFPDDPMLKALEPLYSVVPLSGVPTTDRRYREQPPGPKQPLDKSLRLAAAKAGAKTLIVYWGVLESGREEHGTKIISWVPVVGRMVPDEKQKIRIRLKAAVIDVATGTWEFVIPEAYDDTATSARLNREESDQAQVARLKVKGYEALAKALTARYR
ncbi:MAG: aminopeptidase [Verrucomicrobia subdivision 3 bacterium]|nr:aminopeptidase [Limisphaerales bacterium]